MPVLNTSPPINRKPLPQRGDSLRGGDGNLPQRNASLQRQPGNMTPQSDSSASSFQNHVIDDAAFSQVHPQDMNRQRTPLPERAQIQRQDTMRSEASSHYDDASSTTSPDYASTRKSTDTQESVERPRAGVLRTVGDSGQGDPRAAQGRGFDIPDINFGPTINYGASNVPRNKTPTPLSPPAAPGMQPQRPYSPSGPRKSPGVTNPSQVEYGHSRQESDDTIRRNVAWQPGMAIGGGRDGALSPEQFVQQRAAAAATPMYAHQRTPSGNTLAQMRGNTPTPPLKRTGSHDYLSGMGGHSRSGSADLLQRPSSQGSTNVLGVSGSGEISSHLSAREQEHLARATGSPLINVAGNTRQQQGGGLVGAIEARERERAQMKQGISSQAVQHAINQRQQHQQAQDFHRQQQFSQQQMYPGPQNASMGNVSNMGMAMGQPAPSMYGGSSMGPGNMPMGRGGYQGPPGQGPPQPRPMMIQNSSYGSPQGFPGPAPQVYSPGGFSRPGPPQQGRPQSPAQYPSPQQGFFPPPQGQYSPGQRPGTPGTPTGGAPQGRGIHPYQGQAF